MSRDGRELLALATLVAAVAVVDLGWIARNTAPMPDPNDPYAYLTRTVRFVDALRSGETSRWAGALAQLSLHGRPPLYQLLSTPFLLGFGTSVEAALAVNVAWNALLLVLVYALARELAPEAPGAGLLAGCVAAAYPPLVFLSRVYRPHFAVAACAALSLWLCLRVLRERTPGRVIAFGASLGFGLLIHPTFAWTLAAPSLVAGVLLLRSTDASFLIRGLVPAALLSLGPPAAWYLARGGTLVATATRFAGEGSVATLGFPELAPSFTWYLRSAPGALSNALAAFALAACGAALAGRRATPRALALAAVAAYLVLSSLWVLAWWYFAPVLPILAALTGAWIATLRPRWLARGCALACVAASAFVFGVATFGAAGAARPIARALGAGLDTPTCASRNPAAFCPGAPLREHWPVGEILAAIGASEPACLEGLRRCRVFLVLPSEIRPHGLTRPGVTSSFFDYRIAVDHPEARLELASSNTGGCGLRNLLPSDYVVHFEPGAEGATGCHAAWSRLLRDPPHAFAVAYRELGSFPLPNGARATLRRRGARLSRADVVAIGEALAEPPASAPPSPGAADPSR
jgi:hypothetical protein